MSAPQRKLVRGWQRLVVLLYLGVIGAFLYWWIDRSSRTTLISWGICILAVAVAVTLRIRYPATRVIIQRAFSAYFRFIFWWLLIVGPAALCLHLFRWLTEHAPPILQVLAFVAAATLLAWALYAISTEARRTGLFDTLAGRIGGLAPLAYAFNLLIFAIIFFGSLTYLIQQYGEPGWLQLSPPVVAEGAFEAAGPPVQASLEQLTDFYLWHFLAAIPVLDVPETLRMAAPLHYESGLVGLLLLAFKITVILPIFAAFVLYASRAQRDQPVVTEAASPACTTGKGALHS